MKVLIGLILIISQVCGLGYCPETAPTSNSKLITKNSKLAVPSTICSSPHLTPSPRLRRTRKASTHNSSSTEKPEWVHDTQDNSKLKTQNSKLHAPAAHDYHISNFEIEYNAETKALEIIAKIFIDDLEDGIAASGVKEKLYLCTDREIETGDDYIYSFLSSKLEISLDGEAKAFNYIGKEVSEDLVALYAYLEIEDVQSINEVSVSNDMLMDVFDDQVNMIKLKSKSTGKRGFMMLKKGQHSDTVQLQ